MFFPSAHQTASAVGVEADLMLGVKVLETGDRAFVARKRGGCFTAC